MPDSATEARRIESLINALEKEFRERLHELKFRFFEECEEIYPELKKLIRDKGYSTDLYSIYGSQFTEATREREREAYARRRCVQERIVLQMELSEENLSLDELDTIIATEIAKVVEPDIVVVSAEEVSDEANK